MLLTGFDEKRRKNNAFFFVVCLDGKKTIPIFAPAFGKEVSLNSNPGHQQQSDL